MQKQALEQELVYQAKIRNDAIGIATKDDKYNRFKSFKPADQDAIDEYNSVSLATQFKNELLKNVCRCSLREV